MNPTDAKVVPQLFSLPLLAAPRPYHALTFPQAYDSVLQELAFSLRIPEDYVIACRSACGIARGADSDVDTWVHSVWSHAVSLSFWMLQVLNSVSFTSVSDESQSKSRESAALWISDHFEYAIALIETDTKLSSAESATCDMIRSILRLCARDHIAAAAAQCCIRDLFSAISSRLNDPSASSIPYPLCSFFAHAMVSILFPNPLDVTGRPVSVPQFLSASNAPIVRSVFGVSAATLSAIFAFQFARASSKQPTIEQMQTLAGMVPDQSEAANQSDWEVLFQANAHSATASTLLNVLKNYRNTLLSPSQSAERAVDLVEQVCLAVCNIVSFVPDFERRLYGQYARGVLRPPMTFGSKLPLPLKKLPHATSTTKFSKKDGPASSMRLHQRAMQSAGRQCSSLQLKAQR
jgi:hypothetical protein